MQVEQEIRNRARAKGLQVEVITMKDIDGEPLRFWWFATNRGQTLLNGEGTGLQDQAALEFLRKVGNR
jgi:hypothetical protein